MPDKFIIPKKDILKNYSTLVNYEHIEKSRDELCSILEHDLWKGTVSKILDIRASKEPVNFMTDDIGVIDIEAEIDDLDIIDKLIPWRKGPFRFKNCFIDTEWNSSLKWDRISPYASLIEGSNVADIGSGNGYYAFRMLEHRPRWVLSFDPSIRCKLQFELLNAYIKNTSLQFEMLGIDSLRAIKRLFDVVFCMGVVYHRSDPIGSLKLIRDSLRSEGTIFLESIVIEGDGEYALSPKDRYAKQRNVYFIPTVGALNSWLLKAGFVDLELISYEKTTTEEQKATKYAPWESLKDFLDPLNCEKTVEGYPAPYRACIMAKRKKF